MVPDQYIGKETPRPEGSEKAAGKARYIQDISSPGMLYGKIKFSEYAHAEIKSIDISKAEKLPGVKAVITGYNTPEVRMGFLKDNFALKKNIVRQFRDEIAAVAAVDMETAARAIELIEVEYNPLPGIFTLDEALAEGAPILHQTNARGISLNSNVVPVSFQHQSGNLEEGKNTANYIATGEYSTQLVQHSCMGTAGCIAEFDMHNNLTIWAKTQIPFLAQKDFSEALKAMGLKGKSVRVLVPAVWGAFGTGLDTHVYEYISILLAYKTSRPVKIVYDRREEFSNLSPRQSTHIKISQGCDKNGKLTFRDVHVLQDNGAYVSWGATIPSVMLVAATSLYRVPNVNFDSKLLYTNNTYCQA
ncbi:MAG: molybdopterin-dependent oxidoreductase, partial [SAR324 cluster bacterium]|nr:molybdopterin-dependent oxidoreductase [SAR324 cluster bacterium]